MRLFAYARRGAPVGICVLALGAAGAAAQQAQTEKPVLTSTQSAPSAAAGSESVKPAEPAATNAEDTPPPGTSNLPELVVSDGDKKKKKAAAKAKDKAKTAATAQSDTATQETPPPGVTLGSSAPSDTGTSTFDASNVQLRTTGGGDANTFARNLPNVQYQNQASRGGAGSSSSIDTKPALLSISGGRTYENNFILNGVSITNITGAVQDGANPTDTTSAPNRNSVFGVSPQTIYVPAEFIGTATVIDSNASAEYGQFMGGVVLYDLAAPPTDRYRASVTASHESSDYAHYVLATPDGTNPNNREPPRYEKNNLSASLGAPITSDFAIIGQVSRKEAESSKPKTAQLGNTWADESSDNIFYRFAATARTDIGKFTLDTSHTSYFQRWANYAGRNDYIDTQTESSTTKLEYDTKLVGVRADAIGLGGVKLNAKAFYNSSDTQNLSGDNVTMYWYSQGPSSGSGSAGYYHATLNTDWCSGVSGSTVALGCYEGGWGNSAQSQTDFGAQATVTGNVLLGSFKTGAEIKQYVGERQRMEDLTFVGSNYIIDSATGKVVNTTTGSVIGTAPAGGFNCTDQVMCNSEQFTRTRYYIPAYDVSATVNTINGFAEVDQTWNWFNVRAGARLDYDDYFQNINVAPRLAGTVTLLDGVSVTGGYNRYYIGETLYYAIKSGVPYTQTSTRSYSADGTLTDWGPPSAQATYKYSSARLDTPYNNEYTGVVRIRDPLLDGQWRFKYLERYGEDQFATASCGITCYVVSNNGRKFYQSASAEYTKQWNQLKNAANLNAAAITGNVTWSKQNQTSDTYLQNSDIDGNGSSESKIVYHDHAYAAAAFSALTGNLDIPVRFGATVATVWFNDLLELNVNAGVNLGFNGIYSTGNFVTASDKSGSGYEYKDKVFTPTLKLDVSGRINVSENAAIDFRADNITNSAQNTIGTDDNPWALGRSFWIGSTLKLQ